MTPHRATPDQLAIDQLRLPYTTVDGPLVDAHVLGEPIGQGRISNYGPGRTAHSNQRLLKPWRATVADALYTAAALRGLALPLAGPVLVNLVFTRRKPASAPKTKPSWPVTRPDLDHYERAVLDAGTDAGIWHDDGQVVALISAKIYPDGDPPGARIAVYRVLPDPDRGIGL